MSSIKLWHELEDLFLRGSFEVLERPVCSVYWGYVGIVAAKSV